MLKGYHAQPRGDVSDWAPKMTTMHINPDKIREVIGKGGSVIQNIVAESGAKVDIEDDGTVTIAAVKATDADKAKKMNDRQGRSRANLSASCPPDELRRIRKPAARQGRHGSSPECCVRRLRTLLKEEGDMVWVKVMEIDDKGRINLSMKDVKPEEDSVR